jgi:hypothetical protein
MPHERQLCRDGGNWSETQVVPAPPPRPDRRRFRVLPTIDRPSLRQPLAPVATSRTHGEPRWMRSDTRPTWADLRNAAAHVVPLVHLLRRSESACAIEMATSVARMSGERVGSPCCGQLVSSVRPVNRQFATYRSSDKRVLATLSCASAEDATAIGNVKGRPIRATQGRP